MSAPAFSQRHLGSVGDTEAQLYDDLVAAYPDLSPGSVVAASLPAGFLADPACFKALPSPLGEAEVLAELAELAGRNQVSRCFIGLGYYDSHLPEVLKRNVLENPAWYTAYTPYQAEISQGRLEVLLSFQTMIADLTGLPVANASLLDEASAAAEAMTLAARAARLDLDVNQAVADQPRLAVDRELFDQTRAVVETRARAVGIGLVEFDPAQEEPPAGCFAALVNYLGRSGRVLTNLAALSQTLHARQALLLVSADPLALCLLEAPGELGADVVVGSVQRFGLPLGFGGPHAGYLAVRRGLERTMPGRLVGLSRDSTGQPGLRLTLQTREQHIRREKATSNICTSAVLQAILATLYAQWHGPEGLREMAQRIHDQTAALAKALTALGVKLRHSFFFDTLCLEIPGDTRAVVAAARQRGITLWADGDAAVLLSLDETVSTADLTAIIQAVADGLGRSTSGEVLVDPAPLPDELQRTTTFLTNQRFYDYRSETAMMRYLRRLADADYALDRGMIPLGSCTMKLTAAAEMAAISWPQFAGLHPYAPASDAAGYEALIQQLESWLAVLTGYDAVSLQPNAGSQGEYAGLLAIRGYHLSRGDRQRTICLIPASAHGTNAASAAAAGFSVVNLPCDEWGQIDLAALRQVVADQAAQIGAIMLTYPSTTGVYEDTVTTVSELVHAAGGQVYIDGANFNALAGWTRLGDIGGDVSHLNLHKTFAIPHGGGGSGIGPVAAKAHLADYLPGHPLAPWGRTTAPVAAAPFGSALLLPIAWAYLKLLGIDGLRRATEQAVANANWIADRLKGSFPILFTGQDGRVAHECIVDLRGLTHDTGVTAEDVAKRLIDYGFHAPTLSFPVAGALMVEPTESEPLAELARFCDAMAAIAAEAAQVAAGVWPADDNPLHNSPHTAAQVSADDWTHPYPRSLAAYPAGVTPGRYWPPVSRIDNTYGDRNLILTWNEADQAEV